MSGPEPAPLRLFDGVGVELEYMIVDRASLGVRPIADTLLQAAGDAGDGEVDFGPISWSNELARHVVELKTTDPVPVAALRRQAALFQEHVGRIDARLADQHARLLPGGMHPSMDPAREFRVWPHHNAEIYAAFDRIFGCAGHGWANLQSQHVNLPFGDDEEFGRLHAALRLLLPILPALAASSPMADGRLSGLMDTRLEVYRHNAARVPSVTGRVVPEGVFTTAEYHERILERIYADMAPLDPEGVLRHEWVNARGCIARFDRMAIEIRVLDVQECPRADIAVAAAVVGVARALAGERWSTGAAQRRWRTDALEAILLDVIREGDAAVIRNADYLADLGSPGTAPCRVGDLWRHLIETTAGDDEEPPLQEVYDRLAAEGCLARRLASALGPAPDPARVHAVYRHLADCLAEDRLFTADEARARAR